MNSDFPFARIDQATATSGRVAGVYRGWPSTRSHSNLSAVVLSHGALSSSNYLRLLQIR